jgi:hypothetical protein
MGALNISARVVEEPYVYGVLNAIAQTQIPPGFAQAKDESKNYETGAQVTMHKAGTRSERA